MFNNERGLKIRSTFLWTSYDQTCYGRDGASPPRERIKIFEISETFSKGREIGAYSGLDCSSSFGSGTPVRYFSSLNPGSDSETKRAAPPAVPTCIPPE